MSTHSVGPRVGTRAGTDEAADAAASTCGLDGCQEPLPARPRDELGRPKGGRRARFCSKAHADAASRQRRANDLASIADPLALAKEATQGVLPVARQLSEQLTALMARFEQAEHGALARVAAAETEAEQAHAEAARAAEGEQQAEQARREALAAARADREDKDRATRSAQQARHEAEQIRDEAWKQVAEHERARGQAEAELQAVRTSLELQRREHAELLETVQDQRARITQLDLQVATTGVQLHQAADRVTELSAQLAQEQQQHRQAQARHEEHTRESAARHDSDLQRVREHADAQIAQLRKQLTEGKPALKPAARPVTRRSRVAGQRPPNAASTGDL
ncbi:hypothetical protein [Kineosporia sp. NBRC 101731]|uniref:hypothetical protein n=1 Tax=Kineosporia sp. NBRC 101731 TaxID=3032199 RepID=UPI0024A0FDAA|nr:hypothetical protein [Kineosporia sp. NBRC 101731]GLY29327.1 hypothetical protein Kisp02_26920 [Kineosporia sp. NBRC 101731]